MPSNRKGRVNEELQRELSELIRTLKDPRVQTLLSVTRCEATSDLRYCKVYVSVLEKEREKDVLKGLKSAGGWLRRELGARLQLRYTPELVFVLDDSIERGARISDLIGKLHEKEEGHDNR